MKKRIFGCYVFCLMSAFLFFTAPLSGEAAGSLKDARQEKKVLEDSLKEAQDLIKELKNSKQDITDKVTQLDERLTNLSADIDNLESQLDSKNTEISDMKQVLKQARKNEQSQYESMKIRIQYIYENSRTSYIERLLSAGSFVEFINAVEYINQISEYDRKMLAKYQNTKETVKNTSEKLKQDKEEIKQLKATVQQEQQAVQALLAAKETELASVDKDLETADSLADAFAAEIVAQNEVIEQIKQAEEEKKAARKRAEEERRAAEEKARAKTGSTELPSEGNEPAIEPPFSGTFIWPCPSSRRVTSDYGNRISPTAGASSNHKGIDIGAAQGADIVAAAGGVVVFAGYSSSAGNYVMLDHGGSLYTVYMHASSLCVEKGAAVAQGQVIAKVGSTGISTGNHLHFGVSLDGSYVSPWNYLSR